MRSADDFGRQLYLWGLEIGEEAKDRLLRYAGLLSEYDKANVIGTRDFDEVLRRHVLDSLSCLLFAPLREAEKVADVGSGGGLPGLPLAIMLPEAEFKLFEATGKKAAFLRYAAAELQLGNVRVVNARVEESARDREHRGEYDVCTARALARLSVIAEYALPLLRRGGSVVAMKGYLEADERAEGERALAKLGGRIGEEIQVKQLPTEEQRERRLLVLEKIEETPGTYPRRTGTPARSPLGAR